MCDSFWSYFFETLCPSPSEGVLLWPGNLSRKLIYATDFVVWFKRTQPPCGRDCRHCYPNKPRTLTKTIKYVKPRVFGEELDEEAEPDLPKTIDIVVTHRDHDENIRQELDSVKSDIAHKLPSFSLFCRCRHHSWFDNVKERAKHHHARCVRCSNLQDLCREGWREGRVKVEVYERELALHREEVRKWRNLESSLQHKSKHDLNFVVISYDDTSALQLPRFTNRDLKNFPTSTIDFIPWNVMNYGSGENAYFYTFKNDVKKGGNRICTFLYTLLKRIKFSTVPGHCQKLARELVLMGDNYSENKCNTLFAFCSFLIHLGWFDKIEMLFGPVGHTHNGNDSVHHCHNNIAGDFDSITLPEFLQKFDFAWSKETMRPQPVFFDSCYNWDEFFDPHMNRVGGFSATSQSDLYVRNSRSGPVERSRCCPRALLPTLSGLVLTNARKNIQMRRVLLFWTPVQIQHQTYFHIWGCQNTLTSKSNTLRVPE